MGSSIDGEFRRWGIQEMGVPWAGWPALPFWRVAASKVHLNLVSSNVSLEDEQSGSG